MDTISKAAAVGGFVLLIVLAGATEIYLKVQCLQGNLGACILSHK